MPSPMRWCLPAMLAVVLAPPARPSPSLPAALDWPSPATAPVAGYLPPQAHVWGKYRTLLRKLTIPEDVETYARFHDFGLWNGTEWRNHKGLPPGHWVYVYPHWYIWRDCVRQP